VRAAVPLVSGAAIRFEAQISVYDPRNPDSPCYRCLYGDAAEVDETCAGNGVVAPLLGIAGSVQALEAMKLIMDIGQTLQGRLLLLDGLSMEWHCATLKRDPDCPVCGRVRRETSAQSARKAQATDA
jgi:adenylyltransferase/sulfurtransferase